MKRYRLIERNKLIFEKVDKIVSFFLKDNNVGSNSITGTTWNVEKTSMRETNLFTKSLPD